MNIFMLGGWMMWPLALVSVMVTAIVIERILLFSSCAFPSKQFTESLEQAVAGSPDALLDELGRTPLLKRFAELMTGQHANREAALRIEGEAVVRRLEKHLSMLSILARLAPLMGLLGTVLGMISTFSEIANAQAGVNMNQLAGGIWQALIHGGRPRHRHPRALFPASLPEPREQRGIRPLRSRQRPALPPCGALI
jgi:biopolymer transport protein ExbB